MRPPRRGDENLADVKERRLRGSAAAAAGGAWFRSDDDDGCWGRLTRLGGWEPTTTAPEAELVGKLAAGDEFSTSMWVTPFLSVCCTRLHF